MLVLVGFSAFLFGLLTSVSAQIATLNPLDQKPLYQNTTIYANDGHTVLAILHSSQARVVVPSADISPNIKQAIVAIEDKRFYEHRGVDIHGILRAFWNDVTGGPVQGGSTITQQFVKNAINGNAPTISRKLKEAALAWKLEQKWTKDQILTAYLNTIYFGNGAYGIQEACRVYFGHSAKKATPAEAALLAGIPEDPSLYDPVAHPLITKFRRNLVLRQMYLQGYLDRSQLKTALRAPMPNPNSVRLPASGNDRAPYFANYVSDQLVDRYGAKIAYGGGLKVTTTIDLNLQRFAKQAIDTVLPASIGPSAALVAINVHTGAVLAMIGGRNFHTSQFNLATQGERQPGSAFKPFVMAAALRDGISPASIMDSHPVVINAGGRAWSVTNFEHTSLGPINLSTALAYSDNTVFAQLTNLVGPTNVVKAAEQMGITSPLQPYFSIGLGAEPATPVEMARAYATLANGGYRLDSSIFQNEPMTVKSISFPNKNPKNAPRVVQDRTEPQSISWLTNGNAAIEDQMMQGVVQYGTGTAAQIPGVEIAGKTGTTENYGDAWFVGFTPDVVAAVWVGYPNKLVPMTTQFHGQTVEGGTFPALIWKAFMQKALPYMEKRPLYQKYAAPALPSASVPYSTPSTVIFRQNKLELDNGDCRGADTMQFFSGSAPTVVAPCKPNEVDVPDVRGYTLSAAESRLTGQPLLETVSYAPAMPGKRAGLVVSQKPVDGTLSAYQKVKLVVSRAVYGVVPKLVGMPVAKAQAALARLELKARLTGGSNGKVVAQEPASGVAAAPGMRVVLTVKRAQTAG